MSSAKKEREIQKKKTLKGISYLYKELNSVILILLVPVIMYLPMFRFICTVESASAGINALTSILGQTIDIKSIIKQFTGIDVDKIPEFWSFSDVKQNFSGDNAKIKIDDINFSSFPSGLTSPVKTAFVFLIISLSFAVLALITGIAVKKKWIPAVSSCIGLVCFLCYGRYATSAMELLRTGKVSAANLLTKINSLSSYSNYLKYIKINIRIFELSSAYTVGIIIFVASAAVSLVFWLIEKAYES